NGSGEIGDGAPNVYPTPTQVKAFGNEVAHLGIGDDTTCVIKTDGSTWCIGSLRPSGAASPWHVEEVKTTPIQVQPGAYHGTAIESDGSVTYWGLNFYGESVDPGVPLQQYTTTSGCSCGVSKAGDALCWGDNRYGTLGTNGPTMSNQPPTPVKDATGSQL